MNRFNRLLPKEMRDRFPTWILKVNYHKLQIGSALPKSLQSNLKKAYTKHTT